MNESAHDTYLRHRERWQRLLAKPDEPMRSPRKDALYADLSRAWSRMAPAERASAGLHCCMTYH